MRVIKRANSTSVPTDAPITTGRKKGECVTSLDLGVLVAGAEACSVTTAVFVTTGLVSTETLGVKELIELVVVLYSIDVRENGTTSEGSVTVRRSMCGCSVSVPPGIKNMAELPGLVPLRA